MTQVKPSDREFLRPQAAPSFRTRCALLGPGSTRQRPGGQTHLALAQRCVGTWLPWPQVTGIMVPLGKSHRLFLRLPGPKIPLYTLKSSAESVPFCSASLTQAWAGSSAARPPLCPQVTSSALSPRQTRPLVLAPPPFPA